MGEVRIFPRKGPPPGGQPNDVVAAYRLLALLLDAVSDAVAIVEVEEGPAFRVMLANATLARLANRPEPELVGKTLREIMGDEVVEPVIAHMRRALESRSRVTHTWGRPTPACDVGLEVTYTPMFEDDGHPSHVLIVARWRGLHPVS